MSCEDISYFNFKFFLIFLIQTIIFLVSVFTTLEETVLQIKSDSLEMIFSSKSPLVQE